MKFEGIHYDVPLLIYGIPLVVSMEIHRNHRSTSSLVFDIYQEKNISTGSLFVDS